jgi:hypothetical protein
MKSALIGRVDAATALRIASQRQNLGEGLVCPTGAGDLYFDIYQRPVNPNTLLLDDASCSHYTSQSAARRIEVENNERPYLPVCAAGLRGGDLMAKGRDMQAQNIYGSGFAGNFVKTYSTPNNLPADQAAVYSMPAGTPVVQPYDRSHNAVQWQYRG